MPADDQDHDLALPPAHATLHQWRQWLISCWRQAGIAEARQEAELLLSWILAAEQEGHLGGTDRAGLVLAADRPLTAAQIEKLRQAAIRRGRREPLAYIIGEWEFWSLPFAVTPEVLIPRPETELLVEEALRLAGELGSGEGEPLSILDLGTGSGILAVVLARELPSARVIAVDCAPAALAVAWRNVYRHGVQTRLSLVAADWLSGLAADKTLFDLVVANPPYVEDTALPGLEPEVRDYEPRQALDGGAAGMAQIRRLAEELPPFLRPGGGLLMEIGWDQQAPVKQLFTSAAAWREVRILPDLAGLPRLLSCRRR